MPTTLLTIGPVHTLLQNVTHALPTRACLVTFQPDTAVVEISNDSIDWDVVPDPFTGAFQFETSAAFIRCTDVAGATVVLKAL